MDILSATNQIERAVKAYLSRDEHGLYQIPFEMQRPIILMGPPGVGKTAIVAQIADRMNINFVSYSITHHTRQSALGLPYIATSEFAGSEYKVSRYTMSEIIAAVYDSIEESGVEEGILFLDEVNCASETLAPAMLQFLQYKTFGQHRLPEGWIIVCAGNPPEYNRAARDFDPAMMDRLKRIDIAPDVNVWLDYAVSHGVHPAILTYLTNKPKNFYNVRASVTGTRMVTARGWEDLSRMILAYEREDLPIDLSLISQYLQDQQTAEDFSLYYELFSKYQDDYKVSDVLAGRASNAIVERASGAPFDERVAVVNLLVDAILDEVHGVDATEAACVDVRTILVGLRDDLESTSNAADKSPADIVIERADLCKKQLADLRSKGSASKAKILKMAKISAMMEDIRATMVRCVSEKSCENAFDVAKQPFNAACVAMVNNAKDVSQHLDNVLEYLDTAFGEGQEMLVFVSKLSCDPIFMRFVSAHGSTSFTDHSKGLMFHERGLDLLEHVRELEK